MIGSLLKNSPVYFIFNSKEYLSYLSLLLRYNQVPRYSPREISVLHYHLSVPDCASLIGQFREIFFEEIYKFRSDIPNPVIFDCGANIGISCLYFKKLFPTSQIKAFEADPEIFAVLTKNLVRNNIHDIELINKAVWISDGTIDFGTDGADGGAIQQKNRQIKIESIRLKDQLQKEKRVDFLKIDIEGAELDVLKDCSGALNKVSNLFVEYHGHRNQPQNLAEILSILSENNFRYFLQNINHRKSPLINHGDDQMDLQVNIFAYRDRTPGQ